MNKIDEVIELLKKARLNIPDGITKAQDAICAALDLLEVTKAEQTKPSGLRRVFAKDTKKHCESTPGGRTACNTWVVA